MTSSEEYWLKTDDDRRNIIIDQASRRTYDGVPLEEISDFLLIDRLAVELARSVREIRALKAPEDEETE